MLSTADYDVMSINERYGGLGYTDILTSWQKWLLSLNPDQNNSGPIVFLRCVDVPASGYSGASSNAYSSPYSGQYTSIKVGKSGFTICDNQAIFLPNITYDIDSFHHPNEDRLHRLMKNMSNGVIPQPDNITIGRNEANPHPLVQNPQDFRIITPEFDLDVPDPSLGQTLGPFLDDPYTQPGTFKCVTGAYAYLIRNLKPGKYTISSHGEAENGYLATMLFEVTVLECESGQKGILGGEHSVSTQDLPNVISRLEDQAKTDDEINLDRLKKYIYKCYGIKAQSDKTGSG